jgi:hypothetical protein
MYRACQAWQTAVGAAHLCLSGPDYCEAPKLWCCDCVAQCSALLAFVDQTACQLVVMLRSLCLQLGNPM